MALLPSDDKQKKDDGTDPQATPGVSPLSSSGSPVSSSGASPSSGTGGQTLGGFTNIQDYLSANSGNTGSAGTLAKQVGDAFNTDKQNVDQGSSQASSDAQKQVDSNYIGQDQASKMISQSAGMYGQGGSDYDSNKSKVQGALGATYQGPTSYSYGPSDTSNQYGQDLSNDAGFGDLMKNVYQQSSQGADGSGRALGSGGLALQQQIDSGNSKLNDTRQQLMSDYAGLTPYVDNAVGNANTAIGNAQTAVQTNKNALLDYLTGQQSANESDLQNKANNQTSGINSALTAATGYVTNQNGTDARYNAPSHWNTNVTGQTYVPITTANAAGGTDDRNQFNTISDWLNDSTRINEQSPVNVGNYGLNLNLSSQDPSISFQNSGNFSDSLSSILQRMGAGGQSQIKSLSALGLVPGNNSASPVGQTDMGPGVPYSYDQNGKPINVVRF